MTTVPFVPFVFSAVSASAASDVGGDGWRCSAPKQRRSADADAELEDRPYLCQDAQSEASACARTAPAGHSVVGAS